MRDLEQPAFASAIEAAIGGAFDPSLLILEVTETAALQDARGALTSLHAVKELGVQIALDDFGTGYSSLLGLARLPIDVVKIAQPPRRGCGYGAVRWSSTVFTRPAARQPRRRSSLEWTSGSTLVADGHM